MLCSLCSLTDLSLYGRMYCTQIHKHEPTLLYMDFISNMTLLLNMDYIYNMTPLPNFLVRRGVKGYEPVTNAISNLNRQKRYRMILYHIACIILNAVGPKSSLSVVPLKPLSDNLFTISYTFALPLVSDFIFSM